MNSYLLLFNLTDQLLTRWCVYGGYGMWFSSKEECGWEKNQVLANDASKVIGVSFEVEEPMLCSLGDHTVEKFSSKDGKDSMLENVPSFIRNNLFILNKWNSDVNLLQEDLGNVSVWVKFNGVPITVFSVDRLSAIVTKLGVRVVRYLATFWMSVLPRSSRMCKNIANINGKKKQAELSRQEVSNSNSFNALNYVENDDELCMNGRNSKMAGKGSFNLVSRSSSTTLIAEQIDKLQRKILDGILCLWMMTGSRYTG
uniref:Uncharacterized protein n=1 Tax=Tanacetum cinerariifolium TaxID=118510 RepID=A0A6L2J8S8_TANCI|nr:hypothetical protein [Tanacetum cinerariifolium]